MRNSLKVERAKKNLTQAQLAKLTNVSRQTINAIEQGNYNPSAVLALKISSIFEQPLEKVFQLEKEDWN